MDVFGIAAFIPAGFYVYVAIRALNLRETFQISVNPAVTVTGFHIQSPASYGLGVYVAVGCLQINLTAADSQHSHIAGC